MKINYIHRILALLSLAVLLVPSCVKPAQDEGPEIVFTETVTKAGEAGGSKINTDTEFQVAAAGGFGVLGLRSANGTDFTALVFETDAAKQVTYSGGNWSYANKAKWIRSNYYRFRAFWPYANVLPELNPSSNANFISVAYSTVVDKYDLMVAYETRYPLTQGVATVDMEFKHALAAVSFEVKFDASVSGDDKLTEFYLQGLYPSGSLLYGFDGSNADAAIDAEDIVWLTVPASFDADSKLYRWYAASESEMKTFNKSTEAIVYGNDGLVFVIPQTVTSQTTLNFKTQNAGEALHTASLVSGSGTLTWEPGKVYEYTVTIKGAKISLNVDIKDWTDTDANLDINL